MGFRMDTPDPMLLPAGTHLLEIVGVDTKRSKKSGDSYWLIEWASVDDPKKKANDVWMIEGRGIGMTKKRLRVLQFDLSAEIEPGDLIGKRAYCAVYHDEFEGDVRAKIDSKAEDSSFGMWPELEPPESIANEEAQASNLFVKPGPKTDSGVAADDTPF